VELELVVDEPGAGHRLDRRPEWLVAASEPLAQPAQAVGIGRHRAVLDRLARFVEQVVVETLAAEIQSGVQHGWASLRLSRTRGA
jgi:hypothetical protein